MPERYHNPYHFVPAVAGHRHDDVSRQDFEQGRASHLTHDRYVPETYSGRLVCRLQTVSPIVVGASRTPATERQAAQVGSFKVDSEPAIPGSTLRGLISSVAEAASNSALRVLEDEVLSYRREVKTALSAIGMIVRKDDALYLRPITVPHLREERGGYALPADYHGFYPVPNLKVYIGDEEDRPIRDPQKFPYRTYDPRQPAFMTLSLRRRTWGPRFTLPKDSKLEVVVKMVVAQEQDDRQGVPTNGLVRILGCQGRDDIPDKKKHELFLPYPDGAESWPLQRIPDDVIERFHRLADQRTAADPGQRRNENEKLPYHPQGTRRNEGGTGDGDKFRLKDGDLVYFAAKDRKVSEIALSAVWRDCPKDDAGHMQTARGFFAAIDGELLPFHEQRKVLTTAEQVFGFVEIEAPGTKKPADRRQALAFASRVRFSAARVDQRWRGYMPQVTLRIQASPKPPSPALYFKNADGAASPVRKRELRPGRHHPQGRKFYLHHPDPRSEPWRTGTPQGPDARLQQKAAVTPVPDGTTFYFHLDFDNLTRHELAMLCYALRPSSAFQHKLGLGKALGLGSVRIDPLGLFLVDRQKRYGEDDLLAPRYHTAWVAERLVKEEVPARYQRAFSARCAEAPSPSLLAAEFRALNEGVAIEALEALGDPARLDPEARVHTPLVIGAWPGSREKDTYEWFVANDKHPAPQQLAPLPRPDGRLPTLNALPRHQPR